MANYWVWKRFVKCLMIALVIEIAPAADTWNDPPPPCDSVLQAGHRCHWPDVYFKCGCVPGAACMDDDFCACYAGLTGNLCDQACPYQPSDPHSCLANCGDSDCQLGTNCKQTPGACHCIDGYSGPDCNLCNPAELPDVCGRCGSVECQNDALCDMTSTTCICKEGYHNVDCGYCDPTELPSGCLEHCMYECKAGHCDTKLEACRCPKSFSGHDCSMCDPEMNPDGCATACNAIVCMNEGLCNITKRECVCPPDYYGSACGFCNQTSSRQHCAEYCPTICKYGKCDTSMRQCICDLGYEEASCDRCIPSLHPEECRNHCSFGCVNKGYCDTRIRRCICPLGYLGEDCSVCDPVVHLDNCTSHCPIPCTNNATCDTLSGVCECLPGWSGQACHQPCSEGYFGKNCSNPCKCKGWPCDHITGECFIETTTLWTTTVIPTTEERPSTQAANVFPSLSSSIVVKPIPDLVSTRPIESPPVILLLAFLAAVFLVLIILSVLLYARKHYKRSHFSQPVHDEIPLNNIVIPITTQDQDGGDPECVNADTPLVERDNAPQSISNSFKRSKDSSEDITMQMAKPNPRKSTNLDVDAQRFFTKESGQNFDTFNRVPKGLQLNRNIFDEKEALNKDKLKTSNYEEPIDMSSVCLEEEELKKKAKDNMDVGERDFSRLGSSRRGVDGSEKPTDSGFCEGAVGGTELSQCATGGYEQLASDSGEDSGNSDSEAKGKKKPPVYAQVDIPKRDRSDYQHLDLSIDLEPERGNPQYSSLAVTAPKGYSKLTYEPKRKQPERRVMEENQYDQLRRDENSDTE